MINWFKRNLIDKKFYSLTGKKISNVKHLKNYCEIYENIKNGAKYTNTDPYRGVIFNYFFLEEDIRVKKIIYYKDDTKDDLLKLSKIRMFYKDMDTNEYYYNVNNYYNVSDPYSNSKSKTKFYKCECDILEDKYLLIRNKRANEQLLLNKKNDIICYEIPNIIEYIYMIN